MFIGDRRDIIVFYGLLNLLRPWINRKRDENRISEREVTSKDKPGPGQIPIPLIGWVKRTLRR